MLGAARGYVDYTLTRQAGDSFNVPRVTVPQPEVSDVPFAGTHSEVYFTREKDRWDTETLGVLQPNNGLQDLATRLGYQGGYVKGTMEALGLARNEQRLVANATADARARAAARGEPRALRRARAGAPGGAAGPARGGRARSGEQQQDSAGAQPPGGHAPRHVIGRHMRFSVLGRAALVTTAEARRRRSCPRR